jgi:hypothetical protein
MAEAQLKLSEFVELSEEQKRTDLAEQPRKPQDVGYNQSKRNPHSPLLYRYREIETPAGLFHKTFKNPRPQGRIIPLRIA